MCLVQLLASYIWNFFVVDVMLGSSLSPPFFFVISYLNSLSVCFSGSAQSNAWDSLVPSKKRTFITRLRPKPSPVEKLTRDLYSILHEEQASNLSRTSEDDLLYESGTPFGSSEIGYGGLLIKHPNARLVEEESEASSLPVDRSYIIGVGYSGSASIPVNTENKGSSILNPGTDTKKSTAQMTQESAKR